MKCGIALALLALAVSPSGCGGSTGAGSTAINDPLSDYPKGPTRQFIVPYGNNAIPLYGREGTAAERKQASAVIRKWMRARAAKDFVEECRYLSRSFIDSFVAGDAEVVSEGKVKTCPQALAYFGPDASGDFKNTLAGPIDSLRVPKPKAPEDRSTGPGSEASRQGFAQYHGKGGIDYAISMNREGGKWWVAATAPLNQEG